MQEWNHTWSVQSYQTRISPTFLVELHLRQHVSIRETSGKSQQAALEHGSLGNPSADCEVPENKDWSTQTEPELNNSLISFESPVACVTRRFWWYNSCGRCVIACYSKRTCFKPHCDTDQQTSPFNNQPIPLSFQNGRGLESSSLLQDPQDLLQQIWWAAPNLPALPGRSKQFSSTAMPSSPENISRPSPLSLSLWHK